MPTAEEEVLPRRVDGFELVRVLGRGGMGVVYEARELASGRRVALKRLLGDLALSEEAFERFRREARVAASISDSRCVFVYGAHEVEGAPAIAMELVGGETLEHRIAKGDPIGIETAVRWTIELLEGLEAAAMAGVVHRDVKPSNCFLTADGQVKVGDFGLARTLEADLRLTHTGQFLGSPLYASPEQVKGREVDQRSDLYSVGATLYALLTGKAPHAGSNFGEVLANILSETPPSPRALRPEVPRGLAKLVLKALERDPKRRFQTHAEMRAALALYVSNSSVPASRLRRSFAWVLDYVLATLALLLVLEVVTWFGVVVAESVGMGGRRFTNPWLDVLPFLVTILWFAGFETLLRTTPGKWLCGLHVAGPRLGVLVRTLVFFAPMIGLEIAARILHVRPATYTERILPAEFVATLALFVTMRARNGWRGVHELASSTRVIQRRHPFASTARSAPPPSAPLARHPDAPERIGDYVVDGALGRSPFGVLLQARDAELGRSVWVLQLDEGRDAVPAERRGLGRAGRIRWLDVLHVNGRNYEVFEDPGGASLLACCARGVELPWATMLRLLVSLARELCESDEQRIALHQLWIDRSWNLRVLDASSGQEPGPPLAPAELLVATAKAMLPKGCVLPRDLPEHAESIARRLFGLDAPFERVDEARVALHTLELRPTSVPRTARILQLALGGGPVVLLAVLAFALVLYVRTGTRSAVEAERMARSLASGTTVAIDGASADEAEHRPLSETERNAREILVAAWQRDQVERRVKLSVGKEEQAVIAHALELHPDPSEEELERARLERGPLEAPRQDAELDTRKSLRAIPQFSALLWAAIALASSLLFRGGATFALFDLRLRDRRGRRASRMWCGLRALLTGATVVLLYLGYELFGEATTIAGTFAWIGLAAAVHAALIVASLARPERGLVDRVLGTRVVPK